MTDAFDRQHTDNQTPVESQAEETAVAEDQSLAADAEQLAQAQNEEEIVEEETAEEAEAEGTPVERPAAGETVEFPPQPGGRYVIGFEPTDAQVDIEGNDFVLRFDDGGRIVFQNLVGMAQAGDAPVLRVGGVDIGGAAILGQAIALSGEQPTLETAAGPEVDPLLEGSGANEYNDDLGDPIALLNAQPDIPYTELVFGLPEFEVIVDDIVEDDVPEPEPLPPLVALGTARTVSEQFLPQRSPEGTQFDPAGGPEASTDPANIDIGVRGFLSFDSGAEVTAVTFTDATGQQTVIPEVGPGGASETITFDGGTAPITIDAEEGDFLFFDGTRLLFVDHETGEYIYILAADIDQPVAGLNGAGAGANDAVVENFVYTITDDLGRTASATVTIDVQDDAPIANDETTLVVFESNAIVASDGVLANDEQGADGTPQWLLNSNGDEAGTVLSISNGTTTESFPQPPAGFPAEPPVIEIAGQFGTLSINQLGGYSYQANALPDQAPANTTDVFTYTLIDDDGDTATAEIRILVKGQPDGNISVGGDPDGFIPEDTLTNLRLDAEVGNTADPNEVLSQVVLTLPFSFVDVGADPNSWQIDITALTNALNANTAIDSFTIDPAGTITINFLTDPAGPTANSLSVDIPARPPLDSDVDALGAQVNVTALDTAFNVTGSSSTTADIVVDAVVDGSEVFIDVGSGPQVIEAGVNDRVGGPAGQPVDLRLSLALGPDSTDQGSTPADVSQGDFVDGSAGADATEQVSQITVALADAGSGQPSGNLQFAANLTADGGAVTPTPDTSTAGTWIFDTSGLTAAQVQELVASFQVAPVPADFEGEIDVTVTTVTDDNPTDTEVVPGDNSDTDVYQLTAVFNSIPDGDFVVASGQAGDFIPEDTPTLMTLSAEVGDLTDPNEVLTKVVLDLPFAVDTDTANPDLDAWRLSLAELATNLGVAEGVAGAGPVTLWTFDEATGVLTIELDGSLDEFSVDFTLTPPRNTDVDIENAAIEVTAIDTSLPQTITDPAVFTNNDIDITVDAIVDGSELLQNSAVIAADAVIAGDPNAATPLDLSLTLTQDSTSLTGATNPDPDEAATQGGGDSDGSEASPTSDGSEAVTQIVVTLSVADGVALPTLNFTSPLPAGITLDGGAAVDDTSGAVDTRTWTFTIDPAATDVADVSAFVNSFTVERGDPTSTDDTGVRVETTTVDLATETGPNGASGN